ncbi:flagellar basal body-associated FliL family protein [Pseudomonas sp. Gutcm_11s]|uniref:flagellar basal body-associated FliL family protein n=1 Tax=Pseudomonas sp. Gutcm_11s TaxID=3026088 RepID=UPI00235ED24E|nr:flagellar basal body-associated FliL family protein [Pseudomonas sp. Gutcm_11s]MDD0842004.1 flagellar basal body-associated FliL family protein [Pseudomonas sp. Gutcm_11s]
MPTSRILLIVILLSSLISLGGVGANYFLMRSLLQGSTLATGQAQAGEEAQAEEEEPGEYLFFPVQKIILSLRGEEQEHYFVLDLVLQAPLDSDKKKLEQADPMVRSSAVAHLSAMKFADLRSMAIPDLQQSLEKALLADFAARKVVAPFQHVLVSKLVVQ